MACKFCPKIKRWDFLWIVVMCILMWSVNKYQTHKDISKENRIQLEELEKTRELQKSCMYGDKHSCKQVYGDQ